MKNYNFYELKAIYVEFQERMAVAEGAELAELQGAYEQWKEEQGIHVYCKVWGEQLYGICPVCDKKPCECKAEEVQKKNKMKKNKKERG